MIITCFELLYNLADDERVLLLSIDMPQVPGKGHVVNINGYPYRVVDIRWAIWGGDLAVYAFVDVQKASTFTVTLGGREY